MTLWLSSLPSFASLLVAVAVTNAVALTITFGVRRWYSRRNVTAGPVVVNCWAVSVGGLSALLFAFAILTLWNILNDAKSNVADEGAAIRLVARDLAPGQLPLLRAYVGASAAEWPQLCGGRPDPSVDVSLVLLERLAKPRVPEYSGDLYRQLGVVEDLRYRRWSKAGGSAPFELRIALCVVALSLFGVLGIALPERGDTHAALTVLIATAFGVVFWVITTLAYPYCGSTYKVGPEQITASLRSYSM
ncbi:MAG TPA: hypothetical protein VHT92_04760 [Candidatus Cybelea sp.]|jgi:hypothetical protein|nr:hypothetical protein [Candidatus Cybelea sp.]